MHSLYCTPGAPLIRCAFTGHLHAYGGETICYNNMNYLTSTIFPVALTTTKQYERGSLVVQYNQCARNLRVVSHMYSMSAYEIYDRC